MIRTATLEDLPALRKLLADANDAPYDLATVAEEKCFGEGLAGAPVVRVFDEHGIEGASVTCGRFLRILAVARASRRRGIGTALLRDANAEVIAAEPGNYFTPGVVASDEGSVAFLRARGYAETQATYNLEVALGHHAIAHVRRATHADRTRMLDFVGRVFNAAWRFEAAKAFDRETPTAFLAEESGAIAGFAVHDANNRGLGVFGPTGVTAAMRGRGLGCRLLLASLHDLHRLGFDRAIIPWTDALDFYRKCCGARPAHRFVAFARRGK